MSIFVQGPAKLHTHLALPRDAAHLVVLERKRFSHPTFFAPYVAATCSFSDSLFDFIICVI
jgi:hypothetical protein